MENKNGKPGFDSDDAKELTRKSAFIKQTNDFARFMFKEYMEGDDGTHAMMIIACDGTISEDTMGTANIVFGGRKILTRALAELLNYEEYKELFRMAREMSGEKLENKADARDLKGYLRKLYFLAAVDAVWVAAIIAFAIWGLVSWITTLSNLLMMAFIIFLLVREIVSTRRSLQRIEEAWKEELKEKAERYMALLSELFRSRNNED